MCSWNVSDVARSRLRRGARIRHGREEPDGDADQQRADTDAEYVFLLSIICLGPVRCAAKSKHCATAALLCWATELDVKETEQRAKSKGG